MEELERWECWHVKEEKLICAIQKMKPAIEIF